MIALTDESSLEKRWWLGAIQGAPTDTRHPYDFHFDHWVASGSMVSLDAWQYMVTWRCGWTNPTYSGSAMRRSIQGMG